MHSNCFRKWCLSGLGKGLVAVKWNSTSMATRHCWGLSSHGPVAETALLLIHTAHWYQQELHHFYQDVEKGRRAINNKMIMINNYCIDQARHLTSLQCILVAVVL